MIEVDCLGSRYGDRVRSNEYCFFLCRRGELGMALTYFFRVLVSVLLSRVEGGGR